MKKREYNNVTLVGDNYGLTRLLKFVPVQKINCLIAASIRPQYFTEIQKMADSLCVECLIQPKYSSADYKTFIEKFKKEKTDLLICDSYSMLLREDVLKAVNYNAINVHFALLPKNRGSNPVQWTIIRGERETGVTLHYMDEALDTGDIIDQKTVTVENNDTWMSCMQKIQMAAEKLLEEQIPLILSGTNKRTKQNYGLATINKRLTPEYPLIDFDLMSDEDIYNLIRAQVSPLKGAYINDGNSRIYFDKIIPKEEIKKLRKKYGQSTGNTSA